MIRDFKIDDIGIINLILTEFEFELTKEALLNKFLKIKVYETDKIVGVILYDLIYDRVEIEYIKVIESERNKGIATKLINSIESNVNNITLEVREDNISAINFYKKNGFKVASIRKNYYKNINGLLMIKEMSD